jgi:hypothetical protein
LWRTRDSADDERISQAELIREIGRRLALMLERDSLLEEAATLDGLRAVDRAYRPGLGIPHEWLGRLFERFQRVDLPERASIRGAGLGLYIARQLVELNDGRMWASSDGPGQGSVFHFTLNVAPSRQRSQITPTTRSQEGD